MREPSIQFDNSKENSVDFERARVLEGLDPESRKEIDEFIQKKLNESFSGQKSKEFINRSEIQNSIEDDVDFKLKSPRQILSME